MGAYRRGRVDSTPPEGRSGRRIGWLFTPSGSQMSASHPSLPLEVPTVSHAGPHAAASARPTTGDEGAGQEGPKTWRDVVGAYVGLTKPRVIELLLLTTVPVMFFAERGIPDLDKVVWTVLGGTFSAGSASVFNG